MVWLAAGGRSSNIIIHHQRLPPTGSVLFPFWSGLCGLFGTCLWVAPIVAIDGGQRSAARGATGRKRAAPIAGRRSADGRRWLGAALARAQGFGAIEVNADHCCHRLLNGSDEPFLSHTYPRSLEFGAIWSSAAGDIPFDKHAPFFNEPEVFNAVLRQFLSTTARSIN